VRGHRGQQGPGKFLPLIISRAGARRAREGRPGPGINVFYLPGEARRVREGPPRPREINT